jgi:hypothetical protein
MMWEQIDGPDEIERNMVDVVFPTLEQLAPAPMPTLALPNPAIKTIEEYLFPHRVKLEMVTKDGKPEVITEHHREMERVQRVVPWSEMGKVGFRHGLVDQFPTDQVIRGGSLVIDTQLWNVHDVTIQGNEESCRASIVSALTHRALLREMEIYGKLKSLELDPDISIPKFKGWFLLSTYTMHDGLQLTTHWYNRLDHVW